MRRYRFLRSRKKIEIDITWLCNLTCFDCNRSCGEFPTRERMTIEQIDRFIQESIDRHYHWDVIRILGGEPTLHPDFPEIMDRFSRYQQRFAREHAPRIVVCTNGYAKMTRKRIRALPDGIEVVNTLKEGGAVQHIGHFFIAPRDTRDMSNQDPTLACTHAMTCGIGLGPYGFYHCPIAAGIDRVFGFDVGRHEIPSLEDDMNDQMKIFCELCGFFDMDDESITLSIENTLLLDRPSPKSRSWQEAFAALRQRGGQNDLTPY